MPIYDWSNKYKFIFFQNLSEALGLRFDEHRNRYTKKNQLEMECSYLPLPTQEIFGEKK